MVLLSVRIVVLSAILVSHNFIQNLPLNELLVPWCKNSHLQCRHGSRQCKNGYSQCRNGYPHCRHGFPSLCVLCLFIFSHLIVYDVISSLFSLTVFSMNISHYWGLDFECVFIYTDHSSFTWFISPHPSSESLYW